MAATGASPGSSAGSAAGLLQTGASCSGPIPVAAAKLAEMEASDAAAKSVDEQDAAAVVVARFVVEAGFAVAVKSGCGLSSAVAVCFVNGPGFVVAVSFAAGTGSVAAVKLAGEPCSSAE